MVHVSSPILEQSYVAASLLSIWHTPIQQGFSEGVTARRVHVGHLFSPLLISTPVLGVDSTPLLARPRLHWLHTDR